MSSKVRALAFAAASIAITLFVMSGAIPASAQSTSVPTVTPAPAEASTSLLMMGISGLDLQRGTFDAVFYLGVSCSAPCDAEGWDIVNAKTQTSQVTTREPGQTWWRVAGTFVFQPDVKLFPFDGQTLPIIIEHKRLDSTQMVYVPNVPESAVRDGVGVPGWVMEPFTFTSTNVGYASLGQEYSQLTFTVPVDRSAVGSITKYFIPLLIFILLGASTLVLSRNDLQLRTGGTALVALTIFYLATSGGVGSAGYLTLWDIAILVAYVALGLVLTCGVIGSYLFNEKAFEGPEGEARNKRLRFSFLYLILGIVAVGSVLVVGTAIAT